MAFEIFQDTGARTKEYISITDNKTFGLPRTFVNKQGITSKHNAVLLYDEGKKKIALHFTESSPKFGLKVRIPNNTQGGLVAARAFFDLKGIDVAKYGGRYDNFEKIALRDLGIDKEGIAYVITLTEKAPNHKDEETNEKEKDDVSNNAAEIPF